MGDTGDVDSLDERLARVITSVRSGARTARQAEDDIVDLLDEAFTGIDDGVDSETTAFVERALTVAGELSDDPRLGRATTYDTVRSHLDRLASRETDTRRLDDRLATLRIALSFDCDTEHLELVTLCREGRALDPLLYTDAKRACEVVAMAAEFDVIRALDEAVRDDGDGWQRLGQHHTAWVLAFDSLAAIAWNPGHPRSRDARSTLLELLAEPQTALDAAVRIQPAWLADGHLSEALAALDAVGRWRAMQPAMHAHLDARFAAIEHAVTSLVWLAQDAARSAEVHTLWGSCASPR